MWYTAKHRVNFTFHLIRVSSTLTGFWISNLATVYLTFQHLVLYYMLIFTTIQRLPYIQNIQRYITLSSIFTK